MNRFVLVATLLVLPAASASGRLGSPVAVVEVENGHDSACIENVSGLCPASADTHELGNAEIDGNQELRSIHVAANRSVVDSTPAQWLVPDGSITIRREMLELPNPLMPALSQHVGRVRLPAPFETYVLYFNETEHGVEYVGPSATPLNLTPTQHHHPYAYSSDGGVEYDTIGPSRDYGEASTDQVLPFLSAACSALEATACTRAVNAADSRARAATPNITVGLEFHEIAAATNESAFSFDEALERSSSDQSPLSRRSVADVPRLSRPPPAGAEVRLGAGHSGPPGQAEPRPSVEDRPIFTRATRTAIFEPPSIADHTKALAVAASFALALALAALFSRFHGKEALEHAKRKRILELLDARGPMSFPEVGRALGVDRTTVDYHVRLLIKTGFVKTTRGGRVVYVHRPGQEIDPSLRRSDADASDALLGILRGSGGRMPRGELHHAAGAYSQRARNGALQRLIERGVVERAFEGNVEIVRFTSRAEVNAS